MKKRVLICGNGYVGGYVFAQLSKNTSLDVTLESKATLDYTDEYYLHDYLKEQRFDYLINAQGYTGRPNVDAAERDKGACWKYNVQVPVMFNTVCRELHVQPIHITSSDESFQKNSVDCKLGLGFIKKLHTIEFELVNNSSNQVRKTN